MPEEERQISPYQMPVFNTFLFIFPIAELDIEDCKYRVLLPLDDFFFEEDEDDAEGELEGGGVVIFKVMYDEEGNEFLADIDDDEEWEMVADVWQELAENEEI
jgi:uncharacterized protein YrzB (UPF0473 family)